MKSANSVGNINTAESLQKNRKQFASCQKGSPPLKPGSCLDYTYVYTSTFIICYEGYKAPDLLTGFFAPRPYGHI